MKRTPNPIDKHVGSRVRMRRVLLGMSQEKLGEALGLTFQQVQKYEKGTNRIGASRLQNICKILQAPPSFFFEGAPSGFVEEPVEAGFADLPPTAFVSDFVSTAEGLQLNRTFARIRSAKVRRKVIELVAVLAESDSDQPEPDRPPAI
jgi:transcriptional regulator with XRE-family HTH domain